MAKKRISTATRATKCLMCPNKRHSRGLCSRCLASARGRILRGDVTEADLIERKLMLAKKPLGRPAKSGFAKAFRASASR